MSEETAGHEGQLRFLEELDRVNQAILGTSDLQQMMRDVLDTVSAIFDGDRAFLLYPCDPDASSWGVPAERAKAGYSGFHASKIETPMTSEVAETLRVLLGSDEPVSFGPESEHPLPTEVAEQHDIKSWLGMALHPKTGKPWEFGLHQCSHPRVWTPNEKKLFGVIGQRIADGLSVSLGYQELLSDRRFLDSVFENMPNMVFVKDAQDLRFVRLNKAGEQLLGHSREELLGKTDYDMFPPEIAEHFRTTDRRVLEGNELVDIPEEPIETVLKGHRILHTQKIPILGEDGHPVYLLGICQDITERKELEAQVRQTHRMEAVGQLAGGVAHDFNNMLGVMMGHAEMALEKTATDDPRREDLEEILAAGLRSAKVAQQLLAFARKQTIVPRVLDLNKTVEGMLKLLRRLVGEGIDLAWTPGENTWPVKMDPSQIDQILVNLCVNARDANAGVGVVTIETQNASFDEAYCAEHRGSYPGEYLMLAVSDDGVGMNQRTMDKIFEPFFTTKGVGKGTGMGLATVYGIVKQNAGFIDVDSEPGRGSTFKIYLSRINVPVGQEPAAGSVSMAPSGYETILVVEDEAKHARMLQLVLERHGYRVLTASTPSQALLLAKENAGIHLLLSDVIMPETDGRHLAEEIIALYPGIRCLFMSGYTSDVVAHHGVMDEGVNFIQKPFSTHELTSKVREVLDSKSGQQEDASG